MSISSSGIGSDPGSYGTAKDPRSSCFDIACLLPITALNMSPLRWFITGGSAGLGQALTLHALGAGHIVATTVRSRQKSAEAVERLEAAGAKVVELDVTNADGIPSAIKLAETSLDGPIDVLVNNAGYSLLGAAEDMTDSKNALQFETNFFGPVRLIRTVLPSMRARQTGTIVNISSIAGQDGLPSCAMYAGSKFALEGFSESLSKEIEPFGLAVLIVEPGTFRTNFLSAVQITSAGITAPYNSGPVQGVLDHFDEIRGKQQGDPAKGAARIFEVVTGEGMAGGLKGKILRLPIGADCVERIEAKLEKVTADVNAAREAALATAFPKGENVVTRLVVDQIARTPYSETPDVLYMRFVDLQTASILFPGHIHAYTARPSFFPALLESISVQECQSIVHQLLRVVVQMDAVARLRVDLDVVVGRVGKAREQLVGRGAAGAPTEGGVLVAVGQHDRALVLPGRDHVVGERDGQAQGVEIAQVEIDGHDVGVEVAVEDGGLPAGGRLLRRVDSGKVAPLLLLERVGADLPAAQERRVQVLVVPREAVQHQRVDGVRDLVRQRHARDGRDAVPDVRHLVVRHAPDLAGLQQLDDVVHLLDQHLRLHLEQAMRTTGVSAADQVEGDGRVALGVHSPSPAVLLRLPGEIPHDLAESGTMDEHLNRITSVGGIMWRLAVDCGDVVVLCAVLRHLERYHHLRTFVTRIVLELGDILCAWRNERCRALEWGLELRASDGRCEQQQAQLHGGEIATSLSEHRTLTSGPECVDRKGRGGELRHARQCHLRTGVPPSLLDLRAANSGIRQQPLNLRHREPLPAIHVHTRAMPTRTDGGTETTVGLIGAPLRESRQGNRLGSRGGDTAEQVEQGLPEALDRALLEATDQHGRAWKDLQRTKFQDRSTTNIKNRSVGRAEFMPRADINISYVTLSKRSVAQRRNTSDTFPQSSRRGSQAIDHSIRKESYVRPDSATMSFADLETMAPLSTTDGCFPSVDPSSTSASPSADNLFSHARIPSADDLSSQPSLAEHTSDAFVTAVDNSGQIRAFADFWADGDGLLEPTYDPHSANDSSDWVTATSSRDVFGSRSGSPSNAVMIPNHTQGHANQGAAWPCGEHSSDGSPTCPGRNTFVLRVEDPSPMIITQVTSFLMQSQTKFRMEMSSVSSEVRVPAPCRSYIVRIMLNSQDSSGLEDRPGGCSQPDVSAESSEVLQSKCITFTGKFPGYIQSLTLPVEHCVLQLRQVSGNPASYHVRYSEVQMQPYFLGEVSSTIEACSCIAHKFLSPSKSCQWHPKCISVYPLAESAVAVAQIAGLGRSLDTASVTTGRFVVTYTTSEHDWRRRRPGGVPSL
nr:putative oxidoreductase yusz [Quercus suber]